jgi:ABC-type branched-subunit amino acid transport system substrate-binding protein
MARSKSPFKFRFWFWLAPRTGFSRVLCSLGILTALTGCSSLPVSLDFSQGFPIEWSNPAESSPTEGDRPTTPDQLRLGLLLSLSGNLAAQGSSMQDSARLLIETVNRCRGVGSQAIQLFVEDDQNKVPVGKTGITELIKTNRVGTVIGAIGSEISNATVNIATENQTVQISPASANSILTQRAKRGDFQGFWYRTMSPDAFQGEALARLAHQRGFKTVSILAYDNDYGNSIVQAFETTFKQLGGTISGTPTRYSASAVFLYQVDWARVFLDAPDAVLIVANPDLGSAILKTAAEMGLWSGNTRVLLPASMKTEDLANRVGQSLDGRFTASGVLGIAPQANSLAFNEFRDLFIQQYDREPSRYDATTWDAVAVAALAAEAAKATTGPTIKAQVSQVANPPGIEVSDICQALSLVRDGRQINYQGVSGTVDFTPAGDAVGTYDVWTIDYTGQIKVESAIEAGRTSSAP